MRKNSKQIKKNVKKKKRKNAKIKGKILNTKEKY